MSYCEKVAPEMASEDLLRASKNVTNYSERLHREESSFTADELRAELAKTGERLVEFLGAGIYVSLTRGRRHIPRLLRPMRE